MKPLDWREAVAETYRATTPCEDIHDDAAWIDFLERALLRTQGWYFRDLGMFLALAVFCGIAGYFFGRNAS